MKRTYNKYVKVELLNWEEEKESEIQGQCTSGSISIDGNSSVRRTCSFSMIIDADSENSPEWALRKKIRVWVGDQPAGEEIKWYNEGLFVITSFSKSENTNSTTVNISGQDKMCLLNGTIGGTLYAEVDFGNIDVYNDSNEKVGTEELSIDNVVKEAVHSFGNENYENIQVSDVTDGLQLLQYKGDKMLRLYTDGNGDQQVEEVSSLTDYNDSIEEVLSYGLYKINPGVTEDQWYETNTDGTLKNFTGPYYLDTATNEIKNAEGTKSIDISKIDVRDYYVIAAIDTTKIVKTEAIEQKPTISSKTYVLGDVAKVDATLGQDDQVTMADARQILRYAMKFDDPPEKSSLTFKLADIDGDGDISMADVRLATRMAIQLDEIQKIKENYYTEEGSAGDGTDTKSDEWNEEEE